MSKASPDSRKHGVSLFREGCVACRGLPLIFGSKGFPCSVRFVMGVEGCPRFSKARVTLVSWICVVCQGLLPIFRKQGLPLFRKSCVVCRGLTPSLPQQRLPFLRQVCVVCRGLPTIFASKGYPCSVRFVLCVEDYPRFSEARATLVS